MNNDGDRGTVAEKDAGRFLRAGTLLNVVKMPDAAQPVPALREREDKSFVEAFKG